LGGTLFDLDANQEGVNSSDTIDDGCRWRAIERLPLLGMFPQVALGFGLGQGQFHGER
jgi:hypothetical protein